MASLYYERWQCGHSNAVWSRSVWNMFLQCMERDVPMPEDGSVHVLGGGIRVDTIYCMLSIHTASRKHLYDVDRH